MLIIQIINIVGFSLGITIDKVKPKTAPRLAIILAIE